MTESYELIEHSYDVVIVGAGGAAMRAVLGMAASGLRTACVTKVFPTRSDTVAAQGGMAASLARRAGRVPEAIGGGRRGRHDKVRAECLSRHRIDRKHVWRFG